MDVIQHDVRRLDRLISDISDASRLDAELARSDEAPVNVVLDLYAQFPDWFQTIFHSGISAGALTAIVLNLLLNTRSVSADPVDYHNTGDIAVVGGGNAALCAALMAREAGARVQLLEASPREWRGGNSRWDLLDVLRPLTQGPAALLGLDAGVLAEGAPADVARDPAVIAAYLGGGA